MIHVPIVWSNKIVEPLHHQHVPVLGNGELERDLEGRREKMQACAWLAMAWVTPGCHCACLAPSSTQVLSSLCSRSNLVTVVLAFTPLSTQWLRRSLRLSILNQNFCSGLTAAPTSSFQHQAWYGVAASPLPSHQVDLSGDVIPSGAWKRNQIGGSSLMYCARWSLLKNEKSLK